MGATPFDAPPLNGPRRKTDKPLFHVTYGPGQEKAAREALRRLPNDVRPVLPSGIEVTFLAPADAVGCSYCRRRKSGAATCEGCGAPT